MKQLLNLAFVGYEEFCRSRRVLSAEAEGRILHILLSLIQKLLIISSIDL